jgi:PAS domain S-box-containing protein
VVHVRLADRTGGLRRTADVAVANRSWRLAIDADEVALPAGEATLDELMLIGGSALTLLLALLVYVLATARRRAEHKVRDATAELRQSREQLQLLLDGARDYAIFMLDPAGLVVSWSQSAERLNGYHAEEILGQPYDIFFAPEDVSTAETLRQAREGGVVEVDGVRVRKDGTRFWAHGTLATTREVDGSVRGFVEVVQDVTERQRLEDDRKAAERVIRELNADLERRVTERTAQLAAQTEQLREANAELESFSYSVSHDLRAPLRAVDGFAKMLSLDHDSKLDAEGRRYLARIRAGAQHMGQLIDGLLAFSRLQRQAMTLQPVRMRALVDDVWEELLVERGDRDIMLDVAELPVALGDPRLVRHVLGNLLGNAVKYTRDVAAARIDVGFAQGAYFIRDNGAGFDMRYADKLFKVFQRLHRAEEYEGTGIGLALAHRIVQRHGGRMWAQAEPGRGATFYFTLRIEESDHEAAADESLVGGGQPGRPGVGAARV